MAGTTLCVVDMQPGFGASQSIIRETLREIQLAKKRNDGIVFIELNPSANHRTHKRLVDYAVADGYRKVTLAIKSGGDGSQQFIDAAKAAGFTTKRIRVCGVNRGACVLDTVQGLINKLHGTSIIELAKAATAPEPLGYQKGSWDKYPGVFPHSEYMHLVKEYGLVLKP